MNKAIVLKAPLDEKYFSNNNDILIMPVWGVNTTYKSILYIKGKATKAITITSISGAMLFDDGNTGSASTSVNILSNDSAQHAIYFTLNGDDAIKISGFSGVNTTDVDVFKATRLASNSPYVIFETRNFIKIAQNGGSDFMLDGNYNFLYGDTAYYALSGISGGFLNQSQQNLYGDVKNLLNTKNVLTLAGNNIYGNIKYLFNSKGNIQINTQGIAGADYANVKNGLYFKDESITFPNSSSTNLSYLKILISLSDTLDAFLTFLASSNLTALKTIELWGTYTNTSAVATIKSNSAPTTFKINGNSVL